MDTIFVTGGAGFIGSCFVRRLLCDPRPLRVVNFDKLTYAGNLDNLTSVASDPRYVFVRGDIADADAVGRAFEEFRPTSIVHFAAESHVDRSIDGPAEFVRTNVVGTFELLQAALRLWRSLPAETRSDFRFLHVSTDEVYGSLGADGKFSETSPYSPNSPYSASKAGSDHFVRAYHHTYGLPTLITNCSNNYGPFQFPEKLIPLMIRRALSGGELPVYGDGRQVRDWLHVEDHAAALLEVLSRGRPGETYNIGGDAERTNLEIVERICELADAARPAADGVSARSRIRYVADRPGHDRRYAIDATKIREELGWTPRRKLPEGLADTFAWYLDNASWTDRILSGAYRGERLGLGA